VAEDPKRAYFLIPTLEKLLWDMGNADVLDLGCGSGHPTSLIRKRTTGRVVGVDISEAMLDILK
jgi:ubiquinone/menaquinone biosynthesis C-methylase UbiE